MTWIFRQHKSWVDICDFSSFIIYALFENSEIILLCILSILVQWGIRQNMHKMGFKTLLNNFILFIFDINFLVTKVTECLKEDFLLKRWADVKVWLVGLGAVTGSVNLRRGGDRQGATRKGRFAVYHC